MTSKNQPLIYHLCQRAANFFWRLSKRFERIEPWYGFEGCYCGCHLNGGDSYFGERRHNVCCK